MDHRSINFRPQRSIKMAVLEDNSFKFAPQETAEVFSPSGKSINLKPEPVATVKSLLNGKDVLAVLPTGFGKSAKFQFFLCVKDVERLGLYFRYLSFSKLLTGFDSEFAS